MQRRQFWRWDFIYGIYILYICSSGIHFSIFSLLALKNSVGVAQDACCMIILCKVTIGDNDMLVQDIMRGDLCASFNSM